MNRPLAYLAVLCAVTLATPVAMAAEFSAQLRWEPFQIDVAGIESSDSPLGFLSDTGMLLGVRLDRIVIRAGLGLDRRLRYGEESMGSDGSTSEVDKSRLLRLTPMLQGQFYFAEPQAEHVVPFVTLKLAKTFARISDSHQLCSGGDCIDSQEGQPEQSEFDKELSKQRIAAEEDLLSPWSMSLGGGAEYFLGDGFSLGAEAGLRFAKTSSTLDVAGDDGGIYRQEYEENSLSVLQLLYAVVTLNFYL